MLIDFGAVVEDYAVHLSSTFSFFILNRNINNS